MKWIITGLIVLGVIAAGSTALLLASYRSGLLSDAETSQVAEVASVEIIVAEKDIPAMTMVAPSMIERRTVKLTEVDEGAITDVSQLIGQVVMISMLQGQPFLRSSLASSESNLKLISTLPKGGRAVNISLPADRGIVSLLYPGCLVDVVASFRVPASPGTPSGEIASITLLHGVRVLQVGGRSIVSNDPDKSGAGTNVTGMRKTVVTLLVDSKQAEVLQLALTHGEISLAVRNPLDEEGGESDGILLSELSERLSRRIVTRSASELGATAMQAQESSDGEGDAASTEPSTETADGVETVQRQLWTLKVFRGAAVEVLKFDQEIETNSWKEAG